MEAYSVQMYEDCFDGRVYAHLNFSPEFDYELKTYPEEFLHQQFAEGKLRGDWMLDIGSGPTVRCAVSASKYIANIYLSDLVENNRVEIQKWLKKDDDAIDYSWQFQHVAHLEGISDHHILEERTRKAIKDVIHCNILEDASLPTNMRRQFDVVTSSFCIDCFTDDRDYKKSVKNIAALLRPKGRLALLGTISCIKYDVGKMDFPAVNVEIETVKQTLKEAGFKILVFEERYIENEQKTISNLKGEFGTVCEKKSIGDICECS